MSKRKIKYHFKKHHKAHIERESGFHKIDVPVPVWKKVEEPTGLKKIHEKIIPEEILEVKKEAPAQLPREEVEKKLGLPSAATSEETKETKKENNEPKEVRISGTVVNSYNVTCNDLVTKVNIVKTDKGMFYQIRIPELSKPTRALLETTKQKLINMIDIGTSEITDIHAIEKLKENLRLKSIELLQRFRLPPENIKLLTAVLSNEMIGLGNIELVISDPNLEEVVIASSQEPVRVYHKGYGWMPTNILLENEKQIENYSAIIARRVGRQITTLTPMLDAHLISGDRVNSVLYPICTKGNTITIRKFAREPWTMVDFVKSNTCTSEVFALLWMAIQYEMNILFSGGTASGKTTSLNVCTPFFPANHRILSIEDTRELQLPEHLYWSPLVTRLPNPEGKGEVTMLDLMINSLRMRPDRIILGEVRKNETAEVLFEAMHTGHSVYATVHADTASETIARLVNPPISIAPTLLKALDLNVVMFRDRRRGFRRVSQLAEFIPDESEKHGVKPNIIYRWEPTSDRIIAHTASMRFFEDLSRHTGLSFSEITKELKAKKDFIDNLAKNNIRDMESIGKAVQEYYNKSGAQSFKKENTTHIKKKRG